VLRETDHFGNGTRLEEPSAENYIQRKLRFPIDD
jgi:hypothetical protein